MAEKIIDDSEKIRISSFDTLVNTTEYIVPLKNTHGEDTDVDMVDVKLEETKPSASTSKDHLEENSKEIKFHNPENDDDHDRHRIYDKMIKESIVTIDTTDKRGHRGVSRAQHTFAAKKTVAQGMMDVALITANANQLRYLVEYQRNSSTFFVILFLIIVSLLLQVAVGVSLIFKGRFDIQGMGKSPQARKINNYVVVGVFLITIINVFVAAFSVSSLPVSSASLASSSVQQQRASSM